MNTKKQPIKLVAFDMDGTLLQRRTIFVFAEKLGFTDELLKIINSDIVSYKKSIEIAKILKGEKATDLLKIFRDISLQDHVEHVIRELKNKQITTAIVTNSYQFVADDLKNRLGIDYAFANNLIINKDIVTGELIINNKDVSERSDNCKIHSICKGCVVEQLSKDLGFHLNEVIAIGDGDVDICMIEKAGFGIAFNAPENVKQHADISTDDMSILLNYI